RRRGGRRVVTGRPGRWCAGAGLRRPAPDYLLPGRHLSRVARPGYGVRSAMDAADARTSGTGDRGQCRFGLLARAGVGDRELLLRPGRRWRGRALGARELGPRGAWTRPFLRLRHGVSALSRGLVLGSAARERRPLAPEA